MITYRTGSVLSTDQFIDLLRASTLGERRPIDDRSIMESMLRHANLVITAWEGDLPVGVARSLSDFSYVTYCSDLAVRLTHQRLGIGKELLRRTLEAGGCGIVLLAAPKAADYYPRIGFTAHPSAWVARPGDLT
jgi:GNAT superfamily N-acetyltransferase